MNAASSPPETEAAAPERVATAPNESTIGQGVKPVLPAVWLVERDRLAAEFRKTGSRRALEMLLNHQRGIVARLQQEVAP